ncbi:hypothetical protein K0U73_05525 [bacterium]|nr:hypothetical protein [bacterium]
MSDQTMAFDRASKAREAIAASIAAVRSGEADLSAAFAAADADPLVGRCFAVKVFEAVPGIGKVRARRTMADLGIPEDIWLHQVPADKRAAIIAAFAGPGPL